MQVRDVMTTDVTWATIDMPISEAATLMAENDTGFLPISDRGKKRFEGVLTDRDIVVRAVAKGLDPNLTRVEAVKTDAIVYCFESDPVEQAAQSMQDQEVYRLVVLDDAERKHLRGIVSLGDITRSGRELLGGLTAHAVVGDPA